ncbi:MAG: hypothetical protein KAS32_12045 [Candidatus Peribacteraceae bacterium]|nr:hypothetical protein [Candidatus Peribacteraceae bacterium]
MFDPVWMDKHMKKRGKMTPDWKRESDIKESKMFIGIYVGFAVLWIWMTVLKYFKYHITTGDIVFASLMVPFYIVMTYMYIRHLRRDMTYHLISNLEGEETPQQGPIQPPVPPSNRGTGCGGCFIAGTMITMAEGPNKPIEEIDVGDVVLNYSTGYDDYIGNKVLVVHKAKTSELAIVNDKIKSTPNHRYYRADGGDHWMEAQELTLNTPLLDVKNPDKVSRVESLRLITLDEPVYVYNFTVDKIHNYFADGILVHNIKM